MRILTSSALTLSLAACILAGCQTAGRGSSDSSYIADGAQLTDDGLALVSNAPFDTLFARPGMSLESYTGVWIDEVELSYQPGRREFQLNEASQAKFTKKFKELLLSEIESKSGLELREEVGEHTLHVIAHIVDIKVNVDKDARKHINQKRVFGEESGEMEVQVTLADSQSGQKLLTFTDRQTAESVNFKELTGISIKQDFDRVMRRWAREIAQGINMLHQETR